MDEDAIIACICEGSAEQAIIELLVENKALIFAKHQLLDEKIIRIRSAMKFEQEYLRKQFTKKIRIYRIIDSRYEKFKLNKLYKDKVEVIDIITAPEIEMLIIHKENKYEKYKKGRKKPSDFCKQDLKYADVKSYKFVKNYFSNIDSLIEAIKQHHCKANIKKNEMMLYDLLKPDYKPIR